jgi:hypothetical protein
MPHIDVARPELLDLIEQARRLVVQLNSFTASKQNARKQLLEVLRQGQGMVDVIRTAARQRYGPHSEILVEFGMQPLRGRPRGSEPEVPAPEAPESPDPTPTPELTE